MQQVLDGYGAGVRIQGVAIKQSDPPATVNNAFKEVSAAQQEAQSYINQARAYALQLTAKAQGDAAAFDKVYAQYKLAPEVTRRRMYYETMERVLSKVDKTDRRGAGSNPLSAAARRSSARPSKEPPDEPRRFAIRSLIAFVAILLLILAGSTFAIGSGDQAGGDRPLRRARPGDQRLQAEASISAGPAPGLIARMPFMEEIVWIDKRILSVEMDRQQVLSTDQLRLQVDAFARYRIVDPLRMYISARTEERVSDQLKPILGSALRNELGKRAVRRAAQPGARPADGQYPARAQPGRPPIWRRDRRRPDQARRPPRRNAARIGLPADADRAPAGGRVRSGPRATSRRRSSAPTPMPKPPSTYAEAYGKDPDFYDFYRAMQSYETTFVTGSGEEQGRSSIILSPDNRISAGVQGQSVSRRVRSLAGPSRIGVAGRSVHSNPVQPAT